MSLYPKITLFCLFITAVLAVKGQSDAPRPLHYRPEGRAFLCVNGTAKYTRALYGSPTDWRLETSDRPIFATYKKGHYRNIRFSIECNGSVCGLDSTDYCESRYEAGRRSYVVKDAHFGGGSIRIEALASPDSEQAVWKITADGFLSPPVLTATVSDVRDIRFTRNGDLNADRGDFDPSEKNIQRTSVSLKDDVYVLINADETGKKQLKASETEGRQAFEKALLHHKSMAHRIQFDTPDPFINTIGGALTAATDGLWDGATRTWLHGAVGWRAPLAGWRAAFAGDFLGWNERAREHFAAYAASQVTDVEPNIPSPAQDSACNLARGLEQWGTDMFSNGYISRYPHRTDKLHHYDMNLNFIDEMLTHFSFDADTTHVRSLWPVLKRHLNWEKRNFDPDDDGLYDAYCCIWASDALYYNGGSVTHSSAYNYRAFKTAARMAEMLGEDPSYYLCEAEKTLSAMNERLWLTKEGHWAEYQDLMGLQRVHPSAAVWSIYTPIDCGACTPEQAYLATKYIDRAIPHIPVQTADDELTGLQTISTTDWQPYDWSINNVACAEVYHTALAYFQAGRAAEGYRLLKSNIVDNMYLGASPGNFGQLSHYDKARGEMYRDFGDVVGIASRALIEGLFGIRPDALNGTCTIRPGFPEAWNHAAITTPYLSYSMQREGDSIIYKVEQHFPQPLRIILRTGKGAQFADIAGTTDGRQCFVLRAEDTETAAEEPSSDGESHSEAKAISAPSAPESARFIGGKQHFVPLEKHFNACVTDIFHNEYLSPRPRVTTLELPKQGIGDWCSTQRTAEINDSAFRIKARKGIFRTPFGLNFRTPQRGRNIIYTSLWDNYPDSIVVSLGGRARVAHLLMAGSTNHMQSNIANGIIIVRYADGSETATELINPQNWCPIEQDYYDDGLAFSTKTERPWRIELGTGRVGRQLIEPRRKPGDRSLNGGGATIVSIPLNPDKQLRSLTLRTLSNDVVIGLMSATLER